MKDNSPNVEVPRPLQGLRVLDFTTMMSGPYCTYQLALLGAEVTKIERPGVGDWTRRPQPGQPGAADQHGPAGAAFAPNFAAQNAAKRSVTLDLRSATGLALARQLIARCDVVVENFSAGVADRLGIGFEAACRERADVVYCAISGYGQDGPFAGRPAYDHVVQAASGITMLIGTPASVPNRIGPPLFDYLSGIYAAFAVLAALRERERTGRPQFLDVAMLDAGLAAMSSVTSAIANAGADPQPTGNIAASGSPASGIFETGQGRLAVTANQEAQVQRLCHALGMADALADPRFATAAQRVVNAGALRERLQERLRTRPAQDWEDLLSEQHVPAARVRTVAQALAEPQVRQRQVLAPLVDPVSACTLQLPTIGFKWDGLAPGPTSVPPRLGEHTDETLRGLGHGPQDIERWRAEGVI